ncbi:MAG: hypothetical protein WBI40_05265 [Methylococcaceae bacterium]
MMKSPQSSLLFHQFETEVAVYNNSSGALHLLSSLGADLLMMIQQGFDIPSLINKVTANNGIDKKEAKKIIDEFIDSFENFELI